MSHLLTILKGMGTLSETIPSEKGYTLKGKTFFSLEVNFFPLELTPFIKAIGVHFWFGLEFNSLVNTINLMLSWSIYLTIHLLDRPSFLRSYSLQYTNLHQKLTTALLESVKRRE